MLRKIGWLFIATGIIAILAELAGLQLPTLRWPFTTAKEFSFLNITSKYQEAGVTRESVFPWFGYAFSILFSCLGLWLLLANPKGAAVSPITLRRIQRFKDIRRGYISLWVVIILGLIAGLDQLIVGNQALAVKYNGDWHFPAFVQNNYTGKTFGLTGESGSSPADYRALKKKFAGTDNSVVMPFVPYAPTQDTVKIPVEELELKDGLYYRVGSSRPFNGLASSLYDVDNASKTHVRYRFRKGKIDGMAEGKGQNGDLVLKLTYAKGELISEDWLGSGSKDEFLKSAPDTLYEVLHAPSRPSTQTGHWLGTNSSSYDLIAYLYGGLQVNFKAALFYIPAVYLIGITVGLLMGFFGGAFDLVVQRLIEIFSNIPFLFIVIIISSSVPEDMKGLGIILVILILFGWMGMTYLMRTAAYKEKARDYVEASKVLGASTPRIIFKHILPNTVAILVTLVPFSVSGIVMSLTSLDYLGFGLPPKYATWGALLRDGLDNLSSPWLVLSAFTCLVTLLILVTFIGEAVREAFDPKKYTFYK